MRAILIFRFAICLFAALVFIGSGADCQILKGRITDEKGHPIVHAHIQILRDGNIRNRAYSNKTGSYQMWPVDLGYYQALVTVKGYDRIIRDIDLKGRDSSIIDFSLHKQPGLLAR